MWSYKKGDVNRPRTRTSIHLRLAAALANENNTSESLTTPFLRCNLKVMSPFHTKTVHYHHSEDLFNVALFFYTE